MLRRDPSNRTLTATDRLWLLDVPKCGQSCCLFDGSINPFDNAPHARDLSYLYQTELRLQHQLGVSEPKGSELQDDPKTECCSGGEASRTPDAADIARIKTLTEAIRATWFGYLGLVAFVSVTLFGARDVDFLTVERSTELPIIGVSVPVTVFFLGSAILLTAVYIYLHVYLEQLWFHLGRAEAQYEGKKLSERVHPWLGTEMALNIRQWRRRKFQHPDGTMEPDCVDGTPLGSVGVYATGALLLFAGPGVLAWLWIKSMPAHLFWLTGSIGVLLWLSLWALAAGWSALRDKLGPDMKASN